MNQHSYTWFVAFPVDTGLLVVDSGEIELIQDNRQVDGAHPSAGMRIKGYATTMRLNCTAAEAHAMILSQRAEQLRQVTREILIAARDIA